VNGGAANRKPLGLVLACALILFTVPPRICCPATSPSPDSIRSASCYESQSCERTPQNPLTFVATVSEVSKAHPPLALRMVAPHGQSETVLVAACSAEGNHLREADPFFIPLSTIQLRI